jgi:acyl-CoA thioester hydrolase
MAVRQFAGSVGALMTVHALTYRGVVYPWNCDHMGHMNVMWYVGKFDEATWQLFASIGMTRSYLQKHSRLMAAVDQRIAYRRELQAGDIVSIKSSVIEVRNSSLRLVHQMHDDAAGQLVAVTVLTGVHMDSVTRKPCLLAEEIRHGALAAQVPNPQQWALWPLPDSLLE